MSQVLAVLDLMELRVEYPGVTHFHHSIREYNQEQYIKLLAETTPLQTCFQRWRYITSLWNQLPSDLCHHEFSFSFFFFPWPPLLQHVYSAQITALPHKAQQTAAAISKYDDFAQKSGTNWPLCTNVLYEEGIVMLCDFKSFVSFSIHSNNVWATSKYTAKIFQQGILN